MNQQGAEFRVGGLSLKPGGRVGLGEGESLEKRNIRVPKVAEARTLPPGGRQDWIRFLWETERKHWTGMRRFLKEELGVKVPIVGTIVATSTPNLMADLDVVDSHAYWQHPQFPGKPWDMDNWFVKNISMVDYPDSNAVTRLGLPARGGQAAHGQRVQPPGAEHARRRRPALHCRLRLRCRTGMRFSSTPIRTRTRRPRPAASPVSSASGSIPRSWPTCPSRRSSSAAATCDPAKQLLRVPLPPDKEIDLIAQKGHAWGVLPVGELGLDLKNAAVHRIALDVSGKSPMPAAAPLAEQRQTSDTGELTLAVAGEGPGRVGTSQREDQGRHRTR